MGLRELMTADPRALRDQDLLACWDRLLAEWARAGAWFVMVFSIRCHDDDKPRADAGGRPPALGRHSVPKPEARSPKPEALFHRYHEPPAVPFRIARTGLPQAVGLIHRGCAADCSAPYVKKAGGCPPAFHA